MLCRGMHLPRRVREALCRDMFCGGAYNEEEPELVGPAAHMKLTAGILIGGASRRMGRPKALIRVGTTTLLEQTATLARSVCEEVVLLGRPPFILPVSMPRLQIIEDREANAGPLAGLHAFLTSRPEEACLLLACDMPHLCESLLRRLVEAEGPHDAAVCRTAGETGASPQWHPCCGVYRPSALPTIQAATDAGRLSLMGVLAALRVRPVDLRGDESRWVENWNTPGEARRTPATEAPREEA